ncbi:hypothetical protein HDV00_000676 [Rhizophlyctis rosea]|nr:hypothetical protein HDV00_000676 [Rhizophlyctis rosea]
MFDYVNNVYPKRQQHDSDIKQMMEEELFPISVYLEHALHPDNLKKESCIAYLHDFRFVVKHRGVEPFINLSDLLPHFVTLLTATHLVPFLKTIYDRAPICDRLKFDKLAKNTFQRASCFNSSFGSLMIICPHVHSQCTLTDNLKYNTLRYAIRNSMLLSDIESLIAQGAEVEPSTLRRDAGSLMRRGKDIEGWGVAVGALVKYSTSSEKTRELYSLIATVLVQAGGYARCEPDYFASLEGWIKEGRIGWRPEYEECIEFLERYRKREGFAPERLIGLVEWIMDEVGPGKHG